MRAERYLVRRVANWTLARLARAIVERATGAADVALESGLRPMLADAMAAGDFEVDTTGGAIVIRQPVAASNDCRQIPLGAYLSAWATGTSASNPWWSCVP